MCDTLQTFDSVAILPVYVFSNRVVVYCGEICGTCRCIAGKVSGTSDKFVGDKFKILPLCASNWQKTAPAILVKRIFLFLASTI